MRFIRWLALSVFIVTGFCASCMMFPGEYYQKLEQNCKSFGQKAHDNPNNVYVASLSVGSGECHVVRRGDTCVLIDDGFRCTWLTSEQCINFIKAMLSHIEQRMIVSLPLSNIFLTHSHEDHTNLVRDLLDDGLIGTNKIFFGGIKNEYNDQIKSFHSMIAKKYDIGGFSIECHRINGVSSCNNINGHGSVMSLNFGGRQFAFLGDINDHTLDALTLQYGCLSIHDYGKHEGVINLLKNADILNTPHHTSLANGEGKIYHWLGQQNMKPRVFIASAAPCDTGSATFPRIRRDILQFITEATDYRVFGHNITYDGVPVISVESQLITQVTIKTNEITEVPIFSTFDAPLGFVFTQIEPNGIVSIYNGENFRQVLPPVRQNFGFNQNGWQ